ncbi:MAG: class I SAM-dependent methyltransferase [Thermoleophilia bacterium]|jgi:SAM-dependent methyltransferase|nr:class I SAM-dependent methyltransferase [Thermoleophilia bacterium]
MATTPLAAEHDRLARIAGDFSTETGFNARLIDMRFRAIAPLLDGATDVIEMGCSDGRMTVALAGCVPRLTAVDGSADYVEAVRRRLPGVRAVHSLFEELPMRAEFDVAVLGHVLEHVADPVEILGVARDLVRPGGDVLVTVPNALSLHRLAGVRMGLLAEPWSLNEDDVRIGHRRVYTPDGLEADVREAGLVPLERRGIFLKPLANGQIERDWGDELIAAYQSLGELFPDHCAEILIRARRPEGGW